MAAGKAADAIARRERIVLPHKPLTDGHTLASSPESSTTSLAQFD